MTIQELRVLAIWTRSRAEELTVALTNLMDQVYTPKDAKGNRDIVEYAQDIIKYAKSAYFHSELHQLLWVWGNIDQNLRTHLDSPTPQTTTLQFMEILQESQKRWHQFYSLKNKKFMNC
jgi:tRNA A37 methylthiotransferase MiaB